MRTILIPHSPNGNIYIRELGRAYASCGWTPVYGPENLLEGQLQPDLIHLHWPEEFYHWRGEGSLAERAAHFVGRLQTLRSAGVPMAWTVHNLAPHDAANDIDAEVYRQVIGNADVIHHHCECSIASLAARYPVDNRKPQFVQAHGHYLSYPNSISRNDARKKLGIPADARVFLQFGQIRGYKGLNLLLAAFDRVKLPRKFLLVAGLYAPPTGPGAWRDRLRLAYRKRADRQFLLHGRTIDSAHIQDYVNAADCLVLSHTAGLNSGVAVLGMSFGKPLIGPDMGCLGWVLRSGNNLIYPTGDAAALGAAMERIFDNPAQLVEMGTRNRQVAEQWRWEHLASDVLSHLGLSA